MTRFSFLCGCVELKGVGEKNLKRRKIWKKEETKKETKKEEKRRELISCSLVALIVYKNVCLITKV